MALATWWSGDKLLDLPPLSDFKVQMASDDLILAQLNKISIDEVTRRKRAGHRPYVGYIGPEAITYGWVATRAASIGELNLGFKIPAGERYLWDFATLSEWQGKGLYPGLLQAIIQEEQAEKYWIIHAPENLPSGAGMQKAGFQAVGHLSFRHDGSVGLIPLESERAKTGSELLGVPLIQDGLSPCWGCVSLVVCRCHLNPGECTCSIQVRKHAS